MLRFVQRQGDYHYFRKAGSKPVERRTISHYEVGISKVSQARVADILRLAEMS